MRENSHGEKVTRQIPLFTSLPKSLPRNSKLRHCVNKRAKINVEKDFRKVETLLCCIPSHLKTISVFFSLKLNDASWRKQIKGLAFEQTGKNKESFDVNYRLHCEESCRKHWSSD